MYYVYILKSSTNNRHYVGYTDNIAQRLMSHNNGKVKSTKAFRPWVLLYTEIFSSKQDAYKRERQIKSYKGGAAFKKLLN